MWVLLGVQVFIILLFFILGWAIRSKEAYWMISGFATRPKEEQEQLIESGFPQKSGALMQLTAIGMLLLLPLHFFAARYAIEIQFGFMIVFLMGGLIYLSKFEIPKKRKKSYIISSVLFILVIGFVVGLYSVGYKDFDLNVNESTFEITGMYGNEWENNQIVKVELLEEMPTVTWKENGFGLATMAKGYFTVKGYGSSLLFIHKDSAPYLYIELKDKKIFINSKKDDETQAWFEELQSLTK